MSVSYTTLAHSSYSILSAAWHWFIEALFPKRCLGCGRWGNWCCSVCVASLHFRRQLTCPTCDNTTPLGEFCDECSPGRNLNGLWAAQPYGHPLIRNIIKALKFDGLTELLPVQISLLTGLLKAFNLPPSWHATARQDWLLTAVPLHKRRERQRNFNQAELLATGLTKETGLNYLPTLRRTKQRQPQSEIKDEKQRLNNIEDVFAVLPDVNINGRVFILVDDVYTSGSTLEECAKVLKRAGAKGVWGLTVAKG